MFQPVLGKPNLWDVEQDGWWAGEPPASAAPAAAAGDGDAAGAAWLGAAERAYLGQDATAPDAAPGAAPGPGAAGADAAFEVCYDGGALTSFDALLGQAPSAPAPLRLAQNGARRRVLRETGRPGPNHPRTFAGVTRSFFVRTSLTAGDALARRASWRPRTSVPRRCSRTCRPSRSTFQTRRRRHSPRGAALAPAEHAHAPCRAGAPCLAQA